MDIKQRCISAATALGAECDTLNLKALAFFAPSEGEGAESQVMCRGMNNMDIMYMIAALMQIDPNIADAISAAVEAHHDGRVHCKQEHIETSRNSTKH